MPIDIVSRIWDVFLLDGEVFVHRCALAILLYFRPRLIKSGFDDNMLFLTHLPQDCWDETQLFVCVDKIKISAKHFGAVEKSVRGAEQPQRAF